MLEFIGVFILLKNHADVELCRSIERECIEIPQKELNDIRISSCVKCRIRKDQSSKIHIAVALHECQENINGSTKRIVTRSDEESWKKRSPNVMIASKCMEFTNEEHKHYYLNASKNNSTNENFRGRRSYNLKTKIPCRTTERTRLHESFNCFFKDEVLQRTCDKSKVRKLIDLYRKIYDLNQ